MSETRYIPGYGYAIQVDGRWVVYGAGKNPELLPKGIDLDLLEKSYWDSMSVGRMDSIFDNPTRNCRLLSTSYAAVLNAGLNADFIEFDINSKEVLVLADISVGNCSVAVPLLDDFYLRMWKDLERIYEGLGAPFAAAVIKIRKAYRGAFHFRLNVENASADAYAPFVAINAWAVAEEEFDKYYLT